MNTPSSPNQRPFGTYAGYPADPVLAAQRSVKALPETLRELLWWALHLLRQSKITIRGVIRHPYALRFIISQHHTAKEMRSEVLLYFNKGLQPTEAEPTGPDSQMVRAAVTCLRAALRPTPVFIFPVHQPPIVHSCLQASEEALEQVTQFNRYVRRGIQAPLGPFPATETLMLPLPAHAHSPEEETELAARLAHAPEVLDLPPIHLSVFFRSMSQLHAAGVAIAPGEPLENGLRLRLLRGDQQGTVLVYFKRSGERGQAVAEGPISPLAAEAVETLNGTKPQSVTVREFPQNTPMGLLSVFYHLADWARCSGLEIPHAALQAGVLTMWFVDAHSLRLELTLLYGPGDELLRVGEVRYQSAAMMAELQTALASLYCGDAQPSGQ